MPLQFGVDCWGEDQLDVPSSYFGKNCVLCLADVFALTSMFSIQGAAGFTFVASTPSLATTGL